MTERRTYNTERYGTDVEGPCWTCGSPIRYFVDEDGTPRDITPDTRDVDSTRAAFIHPRLGVFAPNGPNPEPVFTGQMTWPCTCNDFKSDHYFGDRMGSDGSMHTWCQRCEGCSDFRPAPSYSKIV